LTDGLLRFTPIFDKNEMEFPFWAVSFPDNKWDRQFGYAQIDATASNLL